MSLSLMFMRTDLKDKGYSTNILRRFQGKSAAFHPAGKSAAFIREIRRFSSGSCRRRAEENPALQSSSSVLRMYMDCLSCGMICLPFSS